MAFKRGKVIPVIETRTQLAAHLRRNLEALGLERKTKQLTLQELLDQDDETSEQQEPSS